MDKKELILVVAKDLMIAYKLLPKEADRIKPENAVKGLGDLLSKMAKEVEKVHDEISS